MENISKFSTFFSWENISKIGNNKIISKSYFWIVFVPIAAKFLEHIPENIGIIFLDQHINLNISLPFSWSILFFSSVSFSISNGFYLAFCPKIIKDYKVFDDFKSTGQGIIQLKSIVEDFLPIKYNYSSKRNRGKFNQIKDFGRQFMGHVYFSDQYITDNKLEIDVICKEFFSESRWSSVIKSNNEREIFWWIRDNIKFSGLIIRLICSFLYGIGFLMVFYLAFQNFQYVMRFSWFVKYL